MEKIYFLSGLGSKIETTIEFNLELNKYGYEIKDDEDFVSLSEVKKWKDIMKEMLREGMRNPKNYVTDKVTDELNKIGNEWKFKDAEKFEEMLKK